MALDPKFRALLDMPEMQLGRPPAEVTPQMMRDATKAMMAPFTPLALHETRDVVTKGPGGDLPIRIYYPSAVRPLPVILFIHGGGFVVCDVAFYERFCQALARASGCAVASVEYRLAPDCQFPGPVEDCYAALCFLATDGASHGLDPTRIAICGDSAGGSLAIAVTLLARERGGPQIRHQALICPVTDAACDRPSMHEFATGYMLSRDLMKWFWEMYLPSPVDGDHPLASPLRKADLAGLPPATVVTAEFDVLRDEAEDYADRLRAAGVSVVSRRYPGMIHDFVTMPAVTEVADRGIADVALDLRAALGEPGAGAEQSNIALAQQLYGAALTGDWATVGGILADDCTVEEASALPFAGTYVGLEGMQALFAKVGGMLSILDVKSHPMLALGDLVVVPIDLVVDDRGTPVTLPVVELLRFRNGRVVELVPYYFDAAQVTKIVAGKG